MRRLFYTLVLFLASNALFAQNPRWEQVGGTQFTADAVSVDIEFDGNGKLYLGCISPNNSAKMYKFENGGWHPLPNMPVVNTAGNATTIDIAINPTNNNPRVTLKNAGTSTSSQFNVFDFDVSANTWSTYGSNVGSSLYSQGLATKFNSSVSKTYGITSSPRGGTFRKLVRYEKNSSGNWSTIDLINDRELFIDVVGHNKYFSYRKDGLPSSYIKLGYNGSNLTRTYQPNVKMISGVEGVFNGSQKAYVATFEDSKIHLNQLMSSVTTAAIPGASSPKTSILKLDKDEANNLLYLMYLDNSYNITFKQYDVVSSTWSTLPISNIATPNNATGFFATMQVNPVTNDVFVAYKDGAKISVKKYTPQLRIYVNSTATGAGTGASWADAYTSLQDALANVTIDTQEIWVAKGTYKPHASDRATRFVLNKDNFKLYGGFAGTEANLSDRNMSLMHTTNKTILSGDLNGNDTGVSFTNTTKDDNSYKIIEVTGNDVTVDGFTITKARCEDVTSGNYRFGAGVYVTGGGNFTFSNNIVTENIAQWAAGLSYSPDANASITIDACVFSNNLALSIAAFYIIPATVDKIIDAQITNSLFVDNQALDLGSSKSNGSTGAFYAYVAGSKVNVSLVNNTFANNKNSATATTSDHPVIGALLKDGNNGTHIFANNIFWGNRNLNNNTVTPAFGKINAPNIQAFGGQIRNNIDEDNFSLVTSSTTNTSTTNPNLTADYKLQSTSTSAVNKGDNSRIPTGITKDLAGNDRIYNTTVDIGAYEFGGTVVTCANIVNIPDANFKNALLDHGVGITGTGISVIDTDGDGEICQNEAQAYTGKIFVFNKSITDLTGIEAFTSLTELDCRNNQLTSLDVSTNTVLVKLYTSNNQLTSLDVSANTALTEFGCNNNQLTSLDVSTNTALTVFGCDNNQLTSLDVSTNTALTSLAFYNNQLTNLDVSTNTALSILSCGVNQLTSLDVSTNTALQELYCQNNQLTSLNIANGNNINMTNMDARGNTSLFCIQTDAGIVGTTPTGWQKHPRASYIANCSTCTNIVNIPDANFKNALLAHGRTLSGTNISIIDTNGDGEICPSEAQAYTGLIIVFNKSITDLTGIEAFTSLTTLICSNNQLTSLDVSANTALTTLICSNNQLTSLDVSTNTALTELGFANNQLTSIDVSANTALKGLYFGNNQLTSLDVSANTALIRLFCSDNQLTSLDVSANTALTEFQSNNNQLTYLNIANGNNVNITDMRANNNPSLTCIQTDAGIVGTNPAGWQKDTGASYNTNCTTASINDETFSNALQVYPNPVSNTLTVTANQTEISKLTLYNLLGKKVLETTKNTANLSKLAKGLYILKVQSNDNKIATKKIIKE